MNTEEKVQEENYFNFRNIGAEYYSSYDIPNYLMKVLPVNKEANILDIVTECSDTWIIPAGGNIKWCIEVYHEGEVVLGFSPF